MDKSIGDEKTVVNEGSHVELALDSMLGRYRILKLLGRGGMGQVYLAQHELQKSLHAVKILPSEFSGRPGFVERFRTELQTMARLQHPNVVHVQYSDEEGGLYYLVMDFVGADETNEPYDLEEALAEHKLFDAETVRALMLQICEGLAHAHSHGVIHRDLKPANILLNTKSISGSYQSGIARITDFGLAKVVGEEQVHTMVEQSVQRSMSLGDAETFVEKKRSERSSTGAVLGTYGYMSPEQEEGRVADERSDIYALGVMMYRMITGQRLRGMAKPASQVVSGLNNQWDIIIARCLEHNPNDRFQQVDALLSALSALRGSRQDAINKSLSRKWIMAGGAAVLFVLVGGVAVFRQSHTDAGNPVISAPEAALDVLQPVGSAGSRGDEDVRPVDSLSVDALVQMEQKEAVRPGVSGLGSSGVPSFEKDPVADPVKEISQNSDQSVEATSPGTEVHGDDAVSKDSSAELRITDGTWRMDWSQTYALSRSERIPVLVFVHASGVDEEDTQTVDKVMHSDQMLQTARKGLLLLDVNLARNDLSSIDRQFAKNLIDSNSIGRFPQVLLLDGSYAASMKFSASDIVKGSDLFFDSLTALPGVK